MQYINAMYNVCVNVVVSFVAASRIRYEITSGNIGGAFAVKNMTGAIYVAGALDYETRKRVSPPLYFACIAYIHKQHFPVTQRNTAECSFTWLNEAGN